MEARIENMTLAGRNNKTEMQREGTERISQEEETRSRAKAEIEAQGTLRKDEEDADTRFKVKANLLTYHVVAITGFITMLHFNSSTSLLRRVVAIGLFLLMLGCGISTTGAHIEDDNGMVTAFVAEGFLAFCYSVAWLTGKEGTQWLAQPDFPVSDFAWLCVRASWCIVVTCVGAGGYLGTRRQTLIALLSTRWKIELSASGP